MTVAQHKPRFALKTLLATVTLVALCLGYLGASPGHVLAGAALQAETAGNVARTLFYSVLWITGMAATTHYLTGRLCPYERVAPQMILLAYVLIVTFFGFQARLYELIVTMKL